MNLVAHGCLLDVTSFSPPDVSFAHSKFPLLTVSFWLLTVSFQLLTISFRLLTVSFQLLTINFGKLW